MPERRKALGRVSLVPFFARAKKGTRSPVRRVEAFALKNKTAKQSKDAGFPLRACGNDGPGQELDSRLRGNDERERRAKLDSGFRRNDERKRRAS
jgi:hypothetical protein